MWKNKKLTGSRKRAIKSANRAKYKEGLEIHRMKSLLTKPKEACSEQPKDSQ